MRNGLLASVAVAAAVAAVVSTLVAPRSDAAEAPVFVGRAAAEMTALVRAEQSQYATRGRYSERLADLFKTRFGSSIVMNAAALDIDLNVSSEGQTVILRVTSATLALFRVLERGKAVGRGCEVLTRPIRGPVCP